MMLTGDDAMMGLYHVLMVRQRGIADIAVFVNGERYGGFSSEEHALFVIRQSGWAEAEVKSVGKDGVVVPGINYRVVRGGRGR